MVLRPQRNILSLCAGVGGLDLGVKLALAHLGLAGRGVVYVEGEAAAASSLVASMEAGWLDQAPIWSDMRTFDAKPWRGSVHILASGDPCQDNSVAGKGAGAAGERFLAPEVCRVAAECRPDLIFRENVAGNADGQLAAIVPTLEGLGYRVAAGIFSSSETGNTMRRERLFIMAECADFGHEWRGHARRRRDGFADDCCELECAKGERCGEEGRDSGRSEEWPSVTERTLDGPQRPERREINGSRGASGGNVVSRRQEGPDGSGKPSEALGKPNGVRRWTQGHAREPSGQSYPRGAQFHPPTVIPGPTDNRWRDVLDRWPELQPALSEEEAQSHLRRGIDAMAYRVERLRATGNGVDPMVAAYAFLSLGALLAETR